MEPTATRRNGRRTVAIRVALLVLLIVTAVAGLAFDPQSIYEAVHRQRFVLKAWVDQHYMRAVALYLLAYFAGVVLSLPGAVWMTVLGGFLFGTVMGSAYTMLGATAGAAVVFLVGRFVLGDWLKRRAGTFLGSFEAGFRRHALNYLIVLRMLPLFPFWVVNLAPAAIGVPLRTYLLGTVVGIAPGTVALANLGAGLATVIDEESRLTADVLLRPELLVPLLAMAALALGPVVVGHLRRRRRAA